MYSFGFTEVEEREEVAWRAATNTFIDRPSDSLSQIRPSPTNINLMN